MINFYQIIWYKEKDNMFEWENDAQKCQNAIKFIEAAQTLIDTEGIDHISVRKIADKAGLHNSTIYLYFKDLDQLILLASLKHFVHYQKKLEKCSSKASSPADKFFSIWQAFGETVFDEPQIFYNFFFGKYSQNLTPIITLYYNLFPEEKSNYSKEIEDMYYGNSIQERCYKMLVTLIPIKGSSVTLENAELVNRIIVSCFKQLLVEKCDHPEHNSDQLNKLLIQMIRFITKL